MPGDGLQELDVGSRGNECRDGEVAQVVEAEGLEPGACKCRLELAAHEVAGVERSPDDGGEDKVFQPRET